MLFLLGLPDPGEVLAPNIICWAKELGKSGLMICDAAPGISCPATNELCKVWERISAKMPGV